MSLDPQSPLRAEPAVTAARFDRGGEIVYNLALRILGSPGAAWHAGVAAFGAVSERVPPSAPAGTDDRDLLLMGCWHARQMLARLQAAPEYAAQLRVHDAAYEAEVAAGPAIVRANDALPVDQRELLALWGLSGRPHADLAALLGIAPERLATMEEQAQQMLHEALPADAQAGGADAAGSAYRAWAPRPVPVGLRAAVVAAVTPPAATGAGPAPAVGPVAPRGGGATSRSADPHATVEWSSDDVAALGLAAGGTADVSRASEASDDSDWEEPWDEDSGPSGERLQPVARGGRAPRWQIGLVAVLLIAVVVALVLALTRSDDPTPESPAPPATTTTTTPKKKTKTTPKTTTSGAVPARTSLATIRLPQTTIRIVL